MDNNSNQVPNEIDKPTITIHESEPSKDPIREEIPKKTKKSLIYLILGFIIVALFALFLVIFLNNNTVSEEFEELKGFTSVIKEGDPKVYTNEAIEKYVEWSYGDGWHLVEQKPYGSSGIALKFSRSNGDYFHAILDTRKGTKSVNGGMLPDDSHYYKEYSDTYEYEIFKCHKDEIAQLASRLSLDVDIVIEDRDPTTNAYILLNNVELDRDLEKIAKFMVEASKIVDYNINPNMKKSKSGLNVTVNLSGGDNEPGLSLAENQDERNKQDEDYYMAELKSQIPESNS